MARKPLRAVSEDEKPEPKRAKTVTESQTVYRDLLVATRSRIARAVDDPNTPARDLAALTRRLLETAREIEAIDSQDGDDEIGDAANTPDEAWSDEAL